MPWKSYKPAPEHRVLPRNPAGTPPVLNILRSRRTVITINALQPLKKQPHPQPLCPAQSTRPLHQGPHKIRIRNLTGKKGIAKEKNQTTITSKARWQICVHALLALYIWLPLFTCKHETTRHNRWPADQEIAMQNEIIAINQTLGTHAKQKKQASNRRGAMHI